MIDEKKLIEEIKYLLFNSEILSPRWFAINEVFEKIKRQPKTGEWTPCSERMPEEREEPTPIFDPVTLTEIDVRYYTISDHVQITVKDKKGERFVSDDYVVNGKWHLFNETSGFEVLAWQPLPEPWGGETCLK